MALSQEFSTAKKAIIAAGGKVMSRYGTAGHVRFKSDLSPVTEADLISEQVILNHLAAFSYGILAEETGGDNRRLAKSRVWVIDPLDGTTDFLQKTDEFTIMIGLLENQEPILGLVYQPAADTLYWALKKEGAYKQTAGREPKKISVSSLDDLSKARLLVSRNHRLYLEDQLAKQLGLDPVPCGSAGLKACLIAEGKADLYLNSSDQTFEWDICAADLVISEAGGCLSDLNGKRIKYNKPDPRNHQGYLAANNLIHANVLTKLEVLR